MPTYEYKCPDGHHFELFQRMSDEPRAMCPECGASSERLLSGGAGFLFKGDGFYITDSRSESYKKEASREESGGLSGQAGGKPGKEKTSAAPSSSESDSKPKPGSSSSSSGGTSSEGS